MTQHGTFKTCLSVEPGQLWGADDHRFAAGDVMQYGGHLLGYGPYDLVYTDPPWNSGNRKMFHRFAGWEPTDTYDEFYGNLIQHLKHVAAGPIAIDMGLKQADEQIGMLEDAGAHTWGIGKTTYGSNPIRSCVLWVGAFVCRGDVRVPDGLHMNAVNRWVLDTYAYPAGRYYDPCCGNLVFSWEAIKAGMLCSGAELIPNKLGQGLERLAKAGMDVRRLK